MMITIYALIVFGILLYGLRCYAHQRWAATGAIICCALAWLLLLFLLALRGLASGHWPLSNRYEFTLCFVWIMLTIHLLLESYWQERASGFFALLVILGVATPALLASAETSALGPMPPVLRSPWLQGHVLTVMVGYGVFGIGLGLALLRLVTPDDERRPPGLPPVAQTEEMLERMAALGFPWLTMGILTGAIWAYKSWGRYWGWDPKETWALITWLWYLMVLHLLPMRRWRGRRLAWLMVIGFALVLFTFMGVPKLSAILQLDTLHGY